MATKQLVVNSLLASYEDSGSGPVVLLLHGWGDTKDTFKSLEDMLDSCRLIAVDLPGFGKTQAPLIPWTLKDYAEFVSAFVSKLGISNIQSIIGHSNGGAIAVYVIAHGLIESQSAVLIASAGIRNADTARKRLLKAGACITKQLIKIFPSSKQLAIKKRLYSRVGSDLYVAEHLQDTFRNIVREDIRPYAARLAVPALLVYGSEDTATPVAFGKLLADTIPKSRLEVIPGKGHFVHQEASSDVAHLIREFLK